MGKLANYSSFADAQRQFKEKSSNLVCIITTEGKITSRAPTTKDKVAWTCALCNREQTNSIELIKSKNKGCDNYRCKSCFRGKNYYTFVAELEAEGWQLASMPLQYKDTKSPMDVLCPYDHPSNFNYNVWQQEKRVCAECHKESKRNHDINDVIKEYADKGYTLLDTKWISRTTKMDCICSCGRLRQLSYNSLRYAKGKCDECARRTKYDVIEDFFEENGCILLSTDNGQKSEFVINSTRLNYTCFCGENYTSTWRRFKNGARCRSCTNNLIKETCMKIYGVPNPGMSEEIKNKIVATMVARLGVTHHMKLEKYVNAARETNMKNNGGVHNLNLTENREKATTAFFEKYHETLGNVISIREKCEQTNMERLGVKYPLQSPQVQYRIQMNNLAKYDSTVFITSKAGRALMMKKYGVEYAMQHPEFLAKAMRTAFGTKTFIFPSGREELVQGYEPLALTQLLEEGVDGYDICEDEIVVGPEYVPLIPYHQDGKDRMYYPDIYIPSLQLLIEIKSTYTYSFDYEKNMLKFRAAAREGFNFQVWVYDGKHNRVEVRSFYDSELVYE